MGFEDGKTEHQCDDPSSEEGCQEKPDSEEKISTDSCVKQGKVLHISQAFGEMGLGLSSA